MKTACDAMVEGHDILLQQEEYRSISKEERQLEQLVEISNELGNLTNQLCVYALERIAGSNTSKDD